MFTSLRASFCEAVSHTVVEIASAVKLPRKDVTKTIKNLIYTATSLPDQITLKTFSQKVLNMYILLILSLLTAILDWYVVYKGWTTLEYLLKPAVMILLLAWFIGATSGLNGAMAIWFALGLLFSLAGDIFLMLPKEQFIAGLVAFLTAHVFYIIGFNPDFPPFTPLGLFLVIFVAAIGKEIYAKIAVGLAKQDKAALQKPVLAYVVVIAVMLISALFTLFRADWAILPALTVSLGAALFMLSDAILALNRFVAPIPFGRTKNLASYHLGQIMLILGVWLHLS